MSYSKFKTKRLKITESTFIIVKIYNMSLNTLSRKSDIHGDIGLVREYWTWPAEMHGYALAIKYN